LPADAPVPPELTVAGRLDRLDLAVPLVSRMDLDVLVVSQRLVDAEGAWVAVQSLAEKGRTKVWVVADGDGRDRGGWRSWAARTVGAGAAGAAPQQRGQNGGTGLAAQLPGGEPLTSVVVLGAKGGAGKTFVAANLLAALALRGIAVAGVDLDFETGDLALRMGCEARLDLSRAATQPEDIPGHVAVQAQHRIGLWAAPGRPELASLASDAVVRKILESAHAIAKATVIDTPADVDHDSIYTALESASSILLVTTLNPAMVRQCRVMLDLLRRLNYPVRDSLCLVLNRVRKRSLVSVGAASELIGHPVLAWLPDVPALADSEAYYGRSSVSAGPRGALARRFAAIADRVLPGSSAVTCRRWPWSRRGQAAVSEPGMKGWLER
jgi:MinD-like ATPase involved in chromosome partitioning or flagellar assembly